MSYPHNGVLPYPKADKNVLPTGADPTKRFQSIDWNALCAGVDGLKKANHGTAAHVASSGQLTPDLDVASIYSVSLDGALTINAPLHIGAGSRLTFLFTQDGVGGRAVTWDSIFQGTWAPETSAGFVSGISFIYDPRVLRFVRVASNGGELAMGAVGATPNANGASLAARVLTLQPADGTNPGVVSAGAQTFGGAKTFNGAVTAQNLTATDGTVKAPTAVPLTLQSGLGAVAGPALTFDSPSPTSGTVFLWKRGGLTWMLQDALANLIISGDFVANGAGVFRNAIGAASTLKGNKAAGAGPDVILDTTNPITGVMLSVRNAGVEKFNVSGIGDVQAVGAFYSNNGTFTNNQGIGSKVLGNVGAGASGAVVLTNATPQNPGMSTVDINSAGMVRFSFLTDSKVVINGLATDQPGIRWTATDSGRVATFRLAGGGGELLQFGGNGGGASSVTNVQFGPSATTSPEVDITTAAMTLKSGVALSMNGPTLSSGSGSPEGVVTASVGSIYMRTNGGAGTSHYIKESGSGNTGWVAK